MKHCPRAVSIARPSTLQLTALPSELAAAPPCPDRYLCLGHFRTKFIHVCGQNMSTKSICEKYSNLWTFPFFQYGGSWKSPFTKQKKSGRVHLWRGGSLYNHVGAMWSYSLHVAHLFICYYWEWTVYYIIQCGEVQRVTLSIKSQLHSCFCSIIALRNQLFHIFSHNCTTRATVIAVWTRNCTSKLTTLCPLLNYLCIFMYATLHLLIMTNKIIQMWRGKLQHIIASSVSCTTYPMCCTYPVNVIFAKAKHLSLRLNSVVWHKISIRTFGVVNIIIYPHCRVATDQTHNVQWAVSLVLVDVLSEGFARICVG